MNRAHPIYDELLLSCDRRQGDPVTSKGEALRPEEEYAKYSKGATSEKNQDYERLTNNIII